MIRQLLALCAGVLVLTALPALADDRHRDRNPVIAEVFVDFDDPDEGNTLTIRGENLLGNHSREETVVMIGEQGPLAILGEPTENEFKVQCFVDHALSDPPRENFDCNEGDYRLKVAIVNHSRKWRYHHGHDRYRVRGVATYDLTIARPQEGRQNPTVPQLILDRLRRLENQVCNNTEAIKQILELEQLPPDTLFIDQNFHKSACGG